MPEMQSPLLDDVPVAARRRPGRRRACRETSSPSRARVSAAGSRRAAGCKAGRSRITSPAIGCSMDFLLDDEDDEDAEAFEDEDFDEIQGGEDGDDDDLDPDEKDEEEEEGWQLSSTLTS
jgi:hypothetical protein